MADRSFTAIAGSTQKMHELHLAHDHTLAGQDNGTLFVRLKEGTRGSRLHDKVMAMEPTQNGRQAFVNLIAQHIGRDVHQRLLTQVEFNVTQKTFNGLAHPLAQYIDMYRKSYLTMLQASRHVPFRLPTGFTIVSRLHNSLTPCLMGSNGTRLDNAVQNNEGNVATISDFEAAAANLLPKCPVRNRQQYEKQQGKKRGHVSDVEGDQKKEKRHDVGGNLRSTCSPGGHEIYYYKGND